MRRLIVIGLLGLCIGCAKPLVIVVPGIDSSPEADTASAERLPDDCPFNRIAITHSQNAPTMSNDDLAVSAKVAELFRRELSKTGATITNTPEDAYWSLMVMAASDARHYEGFIFSASIRLRDLREGRDPGITAYRAGRGSQSPVLYSGLGFGPGYVLEETVKEFARRADAALLPTARGLCGYAEAEERREADLEAHFPVPL